MVLFIALIVTLLLVIGMPIDSSSWDSSLTVRPGYERMFILAETGIGMMTLLSFFMSSYTQRSKAYLIIASGMVLVLLGRNILFNADTLIALPAGTLLVALGTWLACVQLHHVYLWL
jgi:hypothetical protein